MKFVSAKKITDHAKTLHEKQAQRTALRQKLKALEAEIDFLETFIQARKPEGFAFADDEGYLMEARIVPGQRRDIDLAKVERDYARRGVELPRKTSRWSHVNVVYVSEEE